MPLADKSDREIAEEVLNVLRRKGLRGLRAMEAEAPVSRTTLGAWQRRRYEMQGPTRQRCLEWLGHITVSPQEPLTERQEMLIAAKWLDHVAAQFRKAALAANPKGASMAPRVVVDLASPPRVKPVKRRGRKKEDQ